MIKQSNQEKQKVGDPTPRWNIPPRGFCEGQCGRGDLQKNQAKASAAAVAKDEDSNFLGMSTLILEGCADPETTEVVACHKGLALASDLDL
jgi:hypothetical protein